MSWNGKRKVAIVSACVSAGGTPALALSEVQATKSEVENGIHHYLAKAHLLESGFDEPFVHFDQFEGPAFLHAAVRQHLGSAHPENHSLEEAACPA